jgi:serine phosphatase RsbU (regulator of sigma subunit)/anti-sigma regulatory factor (Ser/Thr protein kinase)
VLLGRVCELVGADGGSVLVLDGDGGVQVKAATGVAAGAEAGALTGEGGFAARVAAAGRPLRQAHAATSATADPPDTRTGGDLLGVPLFARGDVIGQLQLRRAQPRSFTAEDVQIAQLAGERLAVALEQGRVQEEERRLAQTVQHSTMPERLPQLPGFQIAAGFRPGSGAGAVESGGDWYDVIPLADGRVALAMGDVAGRGVEAAALAGQLRSMLRGYVLDGDTPARVADRLDSVLRLLDPSSMVTLLLMVVDSREWSVGVVSAGHPPPLVIPPDGSPRLVEAGRSPPLGVGAVHRDEDVIQIDPDSTLVLYTDGLCERRGEHVDEGLGRIVDVAAGAHRHPEDVCRRLLELQGGDDDASVLVVKASPLSERLSLRVPADADELSRLRRTLRHWLDDMGASDEEISEILLACGEAAANAVEHAYGPRDAEFSVSAELLDGIVVLTVRDEGQWRSARGADRGRGTPLMEALMDSVEVDRSPAGTSVVMQRCLSSAA